MYLAGLPCSSSFEGADTDSYTILAPPSNTRCEQASAATFALLHSGILVSLKPFHWSQPNAKFFSGLPVCVGEHMTFTVPCSCGGGGLGETHHSGHREAG